jgi:hypothetical protein
MDCFICEKAPAVFVCASCPPWCESCDKETDAKWAFCRNCHALIHSAPSRRKHQTIEIVEMPDAKSPTAQPVPSPPPPQDEKQVVGGEQEDENLEGDATEEAEKPAEPLVPPPPPSFSSSMAVATTTIPERLEFLVGAAGVGKMMVKTVPSSTSSSSLATPSWGDIEAEEEEEEDSSGDSKEPQPQEPPSEAETFPPSAGDYCRYWNRDRGCRYGDKCHYVHECDICGCGQHNRHVCPERDCCPNFKGVIDSCRFNATCRLRHLCPQCQTDCTGQGSCPTCKLQLYVPYCNNKFSCHRGLRCTNFHSIKDKAMFFKNGGKGIPYRNTRMCAQPNNCTMQDCKFAHRLEHAYVSSFFFRL